MLDDGVVAFSDSLFSCDWEVGPVLFGIVEEVGVDRVNSGEASECEC